MLGLQGKHRSMLVLCLTKGCYRGRDIASLGERFDKVKYCTIVDLEEGVGMHEVRSQIPFNRLVHLGVRLPCLTRRGNSRHICIKTNTVRKGAIENPNFLFSIEAHQFQPLVDWGTLCELGGKTNIFLLTLHQCVPLLQEVLDDNLSHVVWVQGPIDVLVELGNLHCTL
jgi:hypothetical protein